MNLEDFYDARDIPDGDRVKAPKNVVLVVPDADYDSSWFADGVGIDPHEAAVTWPKDSVSLVEEVSVMEPVVVVQLGERVSRRYPFVPGAPVPDDIGERVAAATEQDAFVVLHHHDEYSLKDGLGTVKQLTKLLKRQRRSFCAVTNHGSVGGWIKQNNACLKAGVKPIFGMEAYVSDYRGDDPDLRKAHRSANHLVLLARNETGFYNIIQIHNDAQLNGFYYSPRMDHAAAGKWGEGIIATSACMAGEIPRLLMAEPREKGEGEPDGDYEDFCAEFRAGRFDEARRIYEHYRDSFDEFYVELQIIEFEMQRECNRRLIEFARKVGAPLILACDSHYLDPTHADTHDLLMYIRQGKTKLDAVEKDEDVWDFDVRNLFYRNARQMEEVFRGGFVDKGKDERPPFEDEVFTEDVFREAMGNTLDVARRIETVELDSTVKLPKLHEDSKEMLREKANAGFKRLGLNKRPNKDVYVERLRHEFDVITRLGWADYFLIMEKIVTMAKEEFYDEVGEWVIGYGRGSAAGCLVSWCLGLTDCDPIEHGLLFERFLDEGRPDPPDIDTDFHPGIRQRVKDRIVEMFGESKTCSIGTYSSYKTKAAIVSVAKALGYDVMEAQAVTKEMDPLKSFETGDGEDEVVDKMDFDELESHYPLLKSYFEKYPEVKIHAGVIRNQVQHMSKHAGGVIISDLDLSGRIPVQLDSNKNIISSWAESGSSAELSEVGLVKYDILGLNNLPVICDCVRLVKENRGVEIKRDEIPLDDRRVIRLEAKGDLRGIFQFENPATKPIVDAVGMESLNDVSAITSLLRPGPKDEGMHLTYAERKNGEPYESIPCLEWIFKDTYGVMVYQEQMMQISQELCGFDGPMANKLRKACVTLDSEFVSRTRGPISLRRMLKDGYKNDLFLQRGEDGMLVWGEISDVWKTGKKRVRRTRSRSGHYVDATRLHQFLTDDGWKAQQRLASGDRLMCSRRLCWDGKDEVGADFMLVMAGLLTEGHTPSGRNVATFVNHDDEFMTVFVEAFEREFGIDGGKMSSCGTVYNIRAAACRRIFKVLGKGLSAEKFLPDVMMGATLETMRQFLSFMLGAEGGVTVSQGTFEYVSKSERMIRQVRTMLLRFGVRSSSGVKNDPKYGRFYRLFVNDMREQEAMLSELSDMWPSWKVADMRKVLADKGDPNFTTDTIPRRVVTRMLNQYPTAGHGESGTLYTANISRDRFARVAEKTGDLEWTSLAQSDFWFDEFQNSDEVVSKHMDVYDFTVADCKLPNMVVNGMVLHNCGKKLKDLMASVKEAFIKGAQKRVDVGEVTLPQVEELWNLIVSFAKYGFNKSHAITYSMITTCELWLKHNYFLEYMTALVLNTKRKHEKHGSDNIMVDYLNYARKRGVEVLAPHVNAPEPDFHIDSGRAIRYGLAHVKNVASAAENIARIAGEKPFESMTDFYERCVYETEIKSGANKGKMRTTRPNNKVVESLVHAGAFDCFGDRNAVLTEYSIARLGIPCPTDEEIEKERVRLTGGPQCPGVNESGADFSAVKGVGQAGEHVAAIAAEKPFESMADFHERCVYERQVKSGKSAGETRQVRPNKKVVEALAYAGAFREFGDVRQVLREYHLAKGKTGAARLTERELEAAEVEMIGLCLSREPICRQYKDLMVKMKWVALGDHGGYRKPTVFGRVDAIEPKTSRAGNPMYIVRMSDGLDKLDFFVFKAGMEYFRDSVKKGQLAAVPLDRFDDSLTRFFDDSKEISILDED